MTPHQRTAITSAATGYAARGWSVLPIGEEKRPCVKAWSHLQERATQPGEIVPWFKRIGDKIRGVAVILGEVSGGLAVRDFDKPELYQAWATEHPELAATLPTAKTARGFHVYFHCPGTRTKTREGGELRGNRVYVILPPSIHPDGTVYQWLNPLPEGALPTIDPYQCGLATPSTKPTNATERTEQTERTERTEPTEPPSDRETEVTEAIWGADVILAIREAIARTTPKQFSTRNAAVFKLARALLAIPGIDRSDPSTMSRLRPYVREWHERAMPNMLTKDWGTTWGDFAHAWPRVKYAEGEDVLGKALAAAEAADPPEWASEYSGEQKLLAALCRELQRLSGDAPFFLSCDKAGQCVGVDKTTAWRWFKAFMADGVLECVTPGDKHKAARWRLREPKPGG